MKSLKNLSEEILESYTSYDTTFRNIDISDSILDQLSLIMRIDNPERAIKFIDQIEFNEIGLTANPKSVIPLAQHLKKDPRRLKEKIDQILKEIM